MLFKSKRWNFVLAFTCNRLFMITYTHTRYNTLLPKISHLFFKSPLEFKCHKIIEVYHCFTIISMLSHALSRIYVFPSNLTCTTHSKHVREKWRGKGYIWLVFDCENSIMQNSSFLSEIFRKIHSSALDCKHFIIFKNH